MAAEHAERLPGQKAETPLEIPPRGWWQVLKRAFQDSSADNVAVLAGGVAFFAFLAVFPSIIAALTVYGLVADPAQVAQQVQSLSGVLPEDARRLLTDQLAAVTGSSSRSLSLGLIVSVLAALWSASTAMVYLVTAISLVYDEQEKRGFLKLRLIGVGLALGGAVFVLVTLVLIGVVPAALEDLGLGPVGTVLAQVARWVLLIGLLLLGLALIYRIAPDRDPPRFRWVTPGAVVATALWVLGTAGFSLYVNSFGNYNKTYGALAGVVVFMLWVYLTSYIVLLGAEVNAEAERQTVQDTTRGEPEPMGTRGAVAADTLAEPPD
ncbi:YihY/virulence factor BrkB family protein [Pseudonocardia bannensis]|uniref:YihY/virulence factor BrkB family protein n=1 Tax=Pseudonocardia bannensis TaxID=630973 RepID=A0A848DGR6_9PSEU|nr:YihY/virulence factor BrkB family protein [Pseudonocardia bannensis]NMH91739.1 YihY/virulence factor BrkB family protein [Pseudonocardia bannensis]